MNKHTKEALYNFCLRLADNNLILAQRLSEWCSRGPILEEDLALTNISLDLLGQAESMYDYASLLSGAQQSADDLAFLRNEREYFNNLLVEQPNGDFAFTMMRQFLFAVFARLLYESLLNSADETLKGLAAKALKEVKYHIRHSSEWIIRMGNGTDESRRRLNHAWQELERFTDDLFEMNDTDEKLISAGIGVNLSGLYGKWKLQVNEIAAEAQLQMHQSGQIVKGGCNGLHTEHLGHLLCEMQYLQRAHPGATW